MMNKKEWGIYNYCIAFLDLLGQREEYKDEGLVPQFASNDEKEAWIKKIRRPIDAIEYLQKDAESMMSSALDRTSEIEFSRILQPELHGIYENMQKTKIKNQRWSDGLVFFTCLGDHEIKCPMNAVYFIFSFAGSMCFLGLAKQQPIRGAIDIAWGIELHDGELYGAAVAKAYELESKVAQYPRVVVSDRTIGYLEVNCKITDNAPYSQINRMLAQMCLNMLAQDVDGHAFINYLGDPFKEYISQNQHTYLFGKAFEFVQEQCKNHQKARDSKLSFRYSLLLDYFMAHPLKDS